MQRQPPASSEPAATTPRGRAAAMLLALTVSASAVSAAHADALGRATAAYNHRDYVRAARELSILAAQGNARAQGLLGFMYEHGFGAPRAYDAAADLYAQGAAQGDPFAQAMLGLMYDKGHGVPRDVILAYKWLNLAAARARGREREAYARFRDAVASKMSPDEIAVGQRLALNWARGAFVRSAGMPR
jgi:TPR repeat protein